MRRMSMIGIAFLAVLLAVSGCRREPNGASAAERPQVCVITPMTHPALDETIRGFKSGMREAGYDRDVADVVVRNAQGEMDKIPALLQQIVARKPRVIFSVTTPASIVAAKVAIENNIPLVYAAVTDPVGAGIVASMEKSETPITGVSDRYPVYEQVKLFRRLMPALKCAGILYSPAEQNSQVLSKQTEEALSDSGIVANRYEVHAQEEVLPRTQICLRENDAVIVNGDNLVTEHLDVVIKACVEHRKPLFVGDTDSVRRGGVATVGPSYQALGRLAGQKAAQILDGVAAGSIPSEYPRKFDYVVNTRSARAMGLSISREFWQLRDIWESRAD